MNTPAHLIFGLAAFGKVDAPKVTAAALAGALIPDLTLYLMAGTHLLILGTDPQIVFGQLYFSDGWQSIFRVDSLIVLWGMGLVFAIWARSAWAMALCGAASRLGFPAAPRRWAGAFLAADNLEIPESGQLLGSEPLWPDCRVNRNSGIAGVVCCGGGSGATRCGR